jgi:NAD(P)H-dependent FMN reductase
LDYSHGQFFAGKAAPKIVSLCASQRVGSFNKMLHDHAVGVMESNGAVVTPIDLNALDLPLYNPELESEAFPSNAQTFKDKLMEAGKLLSGRMVTFP